MGTHMLRQPYQYFLFLELRLKFIRYCKSLQIFSRSYGNSYVAANLSLFPVFRNNVQNLLDVVKFYRICSTSYGNSYVAANLSIFPVFRTTSRIYQILLKSTGYFQEATRIHMLRQTYHYFLFLETTSIIYQML